MHLPRVTLRRFSFVPSTTAFPCLPQLPRKLCTKGDTPLSHNPVMPSSTPSSVPSTPSSETPGDRSNWRFNMIYEPTEWIEAYRPTGYHPVHFGDLFRDGQYKIIRKLGYGAFSTVWLARDTQYESPLCMIFSPCPPPFFVRSRVLGI